MIAVDTNLLVYAHRSSLPEHRRARRALEHASPDPRVWGIALASLAELWSVVTHRAAPRPSTAREVSAFLGALQADGGMQIWAPRTGFDARLLQLATDLDVVGARAFDLQIALTAFEHGASECGRTIRDSLGYPACVSSTRWADGQAGPPPGGRRRLPRRSTGVQRRGATDDIGGYEKEPRARRAAPR
ncbi:MAG: PIN domain-containing protein [Thermodesulfobacteriota bacterium]